MLLYPGQSILLIDDPTASAYYAAEYSDGIIWVSVQDDDDWREVLLDDDAWEELEEDIENPECPYCQDLGGNYLDDGASRCPYCGK